MKKQLETEAYSLAELGARQARAIHALLTGASVDKAAKDAHIGKTTLSRWLKDKAFRAAYQAAQQRAQGWTQHRLQHLAAKAVQTLEEILEDTTLPASTKVEAARTVLTLAGLSTELATYDLASPGRNQDLPQSVFVLTAPPQANGARPQTPELPQNASSDIH